MVKKTIHMAFALALCLGLTASLSGCCGKESFSLRDQSLIQSVFNQLVR